MGVSDTFMYQSQNGPLEALYTFNGPLEAKYTFNGPLEA